MFCPGGGAAAEQSSRCVWAVGAPKRWRMRVWCGVWWSCVTERVLVQQWCVLKVWVSLCHSGWSTASILRRDPTTERHGGFGLLRVRPGPVRPSLNDLVVPGSPRSTISIPNLVRTPDQHRPLQLRGPELKRSSRLSLPVTWITGARHRTRRLIAIFTETSGLLSDVMTHAFVTVVDLFSSWTLVK